MKKLIIALALTVFGTAIFAASYSYKDNTYQKLAEEYTRKAEAALDAGRYELAAEYADKAEENSALSEAYIRKMLQRNDAELCMTQANNRIAYVESIRGAENFPIAYNAAKALMMQAQQSFEEENYELAAQTAKLAVEALAEVREITPLPKFYVVRPWAQTKDCFWNISARPYVYNNPWLWENLYEANKKALPKPSNPNLIMPGMKMEIPSIAGEYRDGVYSPDTDYEPFTNGR